MALFDNKYILNYNLFWRNSNCYVKYFLILASTITGCVFISAFSSLIGIPIEIASSAIGLKICEITAGIKKYKSIIIKKKKETW